MAVPQSYFTFIIKPDLSIDFLDRSVGFITDYFWDFGFNDEFNNPVTSIQRNPQNIVFPQTGKYRIKYLVSNSEGSNLSIQEIEVSNLIPTTGVTIYDMFIGQVPQGIAINLNTFHFLLKKWQLFLKSNYTGSDTTIFIEALWPDMFRVLIAKLITWDYIIKAANATITSINGAYLVASQAPTVESVLIRDYKVELPIAIFDNNFSLLVNLLLINGQPYNQEEPSTSPESLLEWLNSLNKGIFTWKITEDTNIPYIEIANSPHLISTFSYTSENPEIGGVNTAFTAYNQHFIDINSSTTIINSGTSGVLKGGVRKVETGPSNAEWFDISNYWKNIFSGEQGSLMSLLKEDICMYSNHLKLHLSICPKRKTLFLPKNFRKCY